MLAFFYYGSRVIAMQHPGYYVEKPEKSDFPAIRCRYDEGWRFDGDLSSGQNRIVR